MMGQTYQYPNLLTGSYDLSTVAWGDKAKRSGEKLHGAAVADLGAGQWGAIFPTESHRADARATSGAEYVLSFWARADVDGDKIHSEVWGSVYALDAELTTEWQQVVMPYGIVKADQRDVFFWGLGTNSCAVHVALPMCVRGTEPAAWAPAEGETLAGGGALMSANLWQAESVISSETQEGGIYACSGTRGVMTNVALDRLAENQTFHCGFSVNPGADDAFSVALCYRDAAGNVNYAFTPTASAPAGKWTRVSQSVVVPSGMTVYQMAICDDNNASGTSGWKVTNPTLALGSPVCLASSAHTPYATQDHVSATYATQASLKVTDDSIRSLVKGESTYTDPDGQSATNGIYSLVTQTRDAVTAIFGDYTKTSDLASTQAVKDAKKAGTDAQAAASAAQTTADSLATMIREDSTGITVGKSADGKTYSTGRTHMDEDSYDILDKAGNVVATFSGAVISMLMGLLTITAGHNGGGEIYPADGTDFLLKSCKDAEVSGNHGSYLEVNDYFASLNSAPAGGETNFLTVGNEGIVAQTQGVSSLLCPVRSMYNTNNGVHVYTGKSSEISYLTSHGWTDEGVKFYAFLDPGNR